MARFSPNRMWKETENNQIEHEFYSEKLLIVYNPFVELYHYESKSRGQDDTKEKQKRFAKEYGLFVKRWAKTIQKLDPYFNINYRLDTDIPTINYNKIEREEI